MIFKNFLFVFFVFNITFSQTKVLTGADLLLTENFSLIKNKKIVIVTNHSAVLSSGVHLVDAIFKTKEVKINALFGPEHGIRGQSGAGDKIENSVDEATGIPVYSLYGKINKPTAEMLKNTELILFDIQDVGARFYTYISTLFYVLQAAGENKIPVIVLDRPNPISGNYIDGPILKNELKSFVGIAPLPIAHGMTIGELANYFVKEKLTGTTKIDLTVIKMKNWKRSLYYDECGLEWINPSPNLQSIDAAIVYPGTCLIEGLNVSEGRGTNAPFLTIGAPFIQPDILIKELNSLYIKGVDYKPIVFTPQEIPNVATNPKYKGVECKGIKISINDRKNFYSVEFGIKLIYAIKKLFPECEFKDKGFDRLAGDSNIREMIIKNFHPDEIIRQWEKPLNQFKEKRKKYLLYN